MNRDTAMPQSDAGLWRETLATLGASLLVVLFCLGLVLADPQWFWQDDFQSYQLANYYDIARAWRGGEVPLLSPYSWQSGALAGEYQNGVFSIATTGLVLLIFSTNASLAAAGTILSITHLAILAAGAFRLGRRCGMPADLALLAALATALSGWMMIWGAKAWFPALASFAWLPWFWWGLERAVDSRGTLARFVPAGIFLYLIVTAGWPFTVLMAGMLSAWLAARHRAQDGGWLPTWPIALAWLVGLGLSAPAWLMLLEYARETVRGHTPAGYLSSCWSVPVAALPGLVLPSHGATWNVYGQYKLHMSGELAGGLAPLACLLAGCASGGRRVLGSIGWEVGLCGLALVLALLPGMGNFRWSFRWLPFFSLLLAQAGMLAIARARALDGARPARPGTWALLLVAAGCALTAWMNADPFLVTIGHGIVLLAMGLAWAVLERRVPSPRLVWLPCAIVLVSSWFTFAPVGPFMEVPMWQPKTARMPAALDPSVRYLSVHLWPDLFEDRPDLAIRPLPRKNSAVVPGNFGAYSGYEFVNGYSPMGPLDLSALFYFGLHGYLGGADQAEDDERLQAALRLIVAESGPDDLLALMGVDGLMVADRFARVIPEFQSRGWRRTSALPGASVLHRQTRTKVAARSLQVALSTNDWFQALDLVRERKLLEAGWILYEKDSAAAGDEATPAREFAAARVAPQSESRNAVAVRVSNPARQEALIVFSRPWFPGYQATFNGRPMPIGRVNLVLPAVRLPGGESGVLALEYRPPSLQRGVLAAAATLLFVLATLSLAGIRRLRLRSCF